MAQLEKIKYSPDTPDPIPDMYDKINQAIDAINNVLSGGTTGQSIRKINSTDFNYEFFTPYNLPSQTGNSGKVLTTNGTSESWSFAAKGTTSFGTITITGGTATINSKPIVYTILGGVCNISFQIDYTSTSGFPATIFACDLPSILVNGSNLFYGFAFHNAMENLNFQCYADTGKIYIQVSNLTPQIPSSGILYGAITYPLF